MFLYNIDEHACTSMSGCGLVCMHACVCECETENVCVMLACTCMIIKGRSEKTIEKIMMVQKYSVLLNNVRMSFSQALEAHGTGWEPH